MNTETEIFRGKEAWNLFTSSSEKKTREKANVAK